MNFTDKPTIRIAILDLYEGFENQGMRGLREILKHFAETNDLHLDTREFNVRQRNELPDTSWDIYISSGGPGSPLESEGLEWDTLYFNWLREMEEWNANRSHLLKKYIFFICHSFQLACRYFKIAQITKRRSTAFGVFPIHLLEGGKSEPVFKGMPDPFYAVDSRDYQIIQPDHTKLKKTGSRILCIEKERPHVPYERAVMGIRFNEYFIGTQFHPEADAAGMKVHLQSEERKKTVIENYGLAKWESMIERLNDPDKIVWTHDHVIPNFLKLASDQLIINSRQLLV
jgi:GMP synthase-like glutamine amidotransferase